MPHSTATNPRNAPNQSLAQQVRESLVLNESDLVEGINEVLASMPAHSAEYFRRLLKSNRAAGHALKRVAVDVGVVLMLAKGMQADDQYSDSVALVHDIAFGAHDGAVGKFAKAMVECDLQNLSKAVAGELDPDDMVMFDLLPTDVLERRLRLLLAFMDEAMKRAH